MTDINSLLDPASGWIIDFAYAINDQAASKPLGATHHRAPVDSAPAGSNNPAKSMKTQAIIGNDRRCCRSVVIDGTTSFWFYQLRS